MRVLLTAQISGTRDGVDWPAPGSTVDLPDGEAASLVASGQAKTAPPAARELAVPKPGETAVSKPRSK